MYIADFHIHSRYSYATSKTCTLEYLDLWARRKGIHIVGTGDFTHPAWRAELKEKLAPAEDGLYILKEEYRLYDEADGKKIAETLIGRFKSRKLSEYRKMRRPYMSRNINRIPTLVKRQFKKVPTVKPKCRPTVRTDISNL